MMMKMMSCGSHHHHHHILLPMFFFFFFSLLLVFSGQISARSVTSITDFNNGSRSSDDDEVLMGRGQCNWFKGRWVYDKSYPLYDPYKCPFIDSQFDCKRFSRPDSLYLSYRWQPFFCNLLRFNGLYLLRKWRGKKIMFVGDSLSNNQFLSLVCMLHAWVPNSRISFIRRYPLTSVTFQDFGVKIMVYRTQFLVDLVKAKDGGLILQLDSIRQGNMWRGMDLLIFNSWHWWTHTGPTQPFQYIGEGNKVYKEMNRLVAYYKGLTTWARWVNLNVDTYRTRVFFQGISPSHFDGRDWGSSGWKTCSGETRPWLHAGWRYPGGTPLARVVLNKVLDRIKKPVYLLDITELSQYRKDGHPGTFNALHLLDCSHWCLPGLPDTWNLLLYSALVT